MNFPVLIPFVVPKVETELVSSDHVSDYGHMISILLDIEPPDLLIYLQLSRGTYHDLYHYSLILSLVKVQFA